MAKPSVAALDDPAPAEMLSTTAGSDQDLEANLPLGNSLLPGDPTQDAEVGEPDPTLAGIFSGFAQLTLKVDKHMADEDAEIQEVRTEIGDLRKECADAHTKLDEVKTTLLAYGAKIEHLDEHRRSQLGINTSMLLTLGGQQRTVKAQGETLRAQEDAIEQIAGHRTEQLEINSAVDERITGLATVVTELISRMDSVEADTTAGNAQKRKEVSSIIRKLASVQKALDGKENKVYLFRP